MAEQNIVMKQLNNSGEYDTLYPATVGQQVSGLTFSMVEGNLDASKVTGLPTSLPANGGNADTVGGQSVEEIIAQAIASGAKIATGSYIGTGTYGQNSPNSLTFESDPVLLFITGVEVESLIYIAVIMCNANTGIGFNAGTVDWTSSWGSGGLIVIKTGNKVDWYVAAEISASEAPGAQMNLSGITYTYTAILN